MNKNKHTTCINYTLTERDTIPLLESSELIEDSIFSSLLSEFFINYHLEILSNTGLVLDTDLLLSHNNIDIQLGSNVIYNEGEHLFTENIPKLTPAPLTTETDLKVCLNIDKLETYNGNIYAILKMSAFKIEEVQPLFSQQMLYQFSLFTDDSHKEIIETKKALTLLQKTLKEFKSE